MSTFINKRLDIYPSKYVEVNHNTRLSTLFEVFIENFYRMFPNIMPKDEIYRRLSNNISSVIFSPLVDINGEYLCGRYLCNKKVVQLNNDLNHKNFNLTLFI